LLYVADIHQPLHVGAEYFDRQGRAVDPNEDQSALGNEGGNTFTLELSDEPPRRRGIHRKKLHGFWDKDAVNALFLQWPVAPRKSEMQTIIEPHKRELVYEMATHEPNNWRMPPNVPVDNYSEIWANEILPVAREAYARLDFKNVRAQTEEDRIVAAGGSSRKTDCDSNELSRVGNRRCPTRITQSRLASCRFAAENFVAKKCEPLSSVSVARV
jgi:S1/P1 Nuclease